VSIGGLTGVAEHEAGLASGLLNTSQQLGGALGVAIASTVAATRLGTLLGQGKPANVALTGAFHWAFWVCGMLALLALPATAALLPRRKAAPADDERPVVAPAAYRG
jgi:sugar phosphate permease